ncbi:MAG: alanine:cation symporter family protein, partial [Phycisphaeraceae bacterium]|nr:alanine:cation symporter family protein [Phycisphaeraceae bacterium]
GGGLIGVLIIGFQRAAFSSEAGLGSSAIAHSAAKSAEPVREGLVASLEPFIDTIVICFLSGMTVLITGAYAAPETVGIGGSEVTLLAFEKTGPLAGWFPTVLSISIILFAFSTMISWAYYGEQAWGYLFGSGSVLVFRLAFVLCVLLGTVVTASNVILFADLMLLSMAVPNIIGGIILAPKVKAKLKQYWQKYRAGETGPPADQYEI